MGLFSKSKTSVATSVSRVIDDFGVPNSIKTGMVQSLQANDGQMTENVMEQMSSSIGLKAERMFKYAQKSYHWGMPSGELVSSLDAKDLVKAQLDLQEGKAVTLEYYYLGFPNLMHIGWYTLANNFNYDSVTNEIKTMSLVKGYPVFLTNMVVVVQDATLQERENGSLDQWGIPPNAGPAPGKSEVPLPGKGIAGQGPFWVDSNTDQDYIYVTYSWEEEEVIEISPGLNSTKKVVKTGSFNILVGGYDTSADYHMARYKVDGKSKFFMYKHESGTYPTIDTAIANNTPSDGSFFPFAYFRYEKKDTSLDKTTAAYKSTKKMLKYLDIDYDEMSTAINDETDRPEIKDVEQAMLVMAVPADSDNEMELRYLFDFFSRAESATAPSTSTGNTQAINQIKRVLGYNTAKHTYIIEDQRFKMTLQFDSVVRSIGKGKLGKIGTYAGGFSTTEYNKQALNASTGTPITWSSKVPCHMYRKQISEDQYEEVAVHGLRMTYHIFGGHNVLADENDTILLIPLDHDITKGYSIPKREELYSRSLHYVFNSLVIQKLKWYQTGVFKAILIIVMIVITVITYGATIKGLYAAIIAGTVTMAMVQAIVIALIKYLIVSLIVRLFVKVVGVKFAFIAALVAVAAAVITGNSEGLNSIASSLPSPTTLLQLASNITSAISDSLKDSFMDLMKEQESFGLFVKEQETLLENAEKLLDYDHRLAPMVIFGEKPDEFYQRTVHSGNIGVLGLDIVSNYVQTSLTLPRLMESIGEDPNV